MLELTMFETMFRTLEPCLKQLFYLDCKSTWPAEYCSITSELDNLFTFSKCSDKDIKQV